MSTSDRITRPSPERTAPRRGFSNLFAGSPTPTDASEAVSRAVGLGYQVIDEYLRQGERAARAFGNLARPANPPRDVQDLGARMAQYMAQYAQEMAGIWMQLFQVALGNAVQSATPAVPPATNGATRADTPATAGEPLRVSVELISRRPVEVTIDLRPGSTAAPLVVPDLRDATGALPRIAGVVVEGGERPRLRVSVADDQPPGVYHGVVVDPHTSVAVGTVTVRVPA
jgi:hypothetical protein